MLLNGDVIPSLHVRVDEVALATLYIMVASGVTSFDAAFGIEVAIWPAPHAHVGVDTVAVTGGLNGSAMVVLLDNPVSGDGGQAFAAADVDVLDVGVGAGHDRVKLVTHLTVVERNSWENSTGPHVALDQGGGGGIRAVDTGLNDRGTLKEDGDSIAFGLTVACGGTCSRLAC